MWRKFCGLMLRLLGWRAGEPLPPDDKCIILGVPHTSFWDFIVSYLYFTSIGGNAVCMIKKELFFPPLGWILRAMGGIPVDRKNSTSMIRSVINSANGCKVFHLAIAPEGTRKAVRRWKTGFHTIAKHASLPVYMGYFDWNRHVVGRGERIELTDNAVEDMKRIQQMYEEMNLGAKHPKQYLTR